MQFVKYSKMILNLNLAIFVNSLLLHFEKSKNFR